MLELGRKLRWVAAIPAVADDDHHSAVSEHAARPLAIEIAERGADARAAAEVVYALADGIEHLVDVTLAQQARDAREPRRENEGLEVLAPRHRVGKDHQQPRVALHRSADVADEHQRPAPHRRTPPEELDQLAARPDRMPRRAAEVDTSRACRAHAASAPLGHAPR